MRKPVPHTGFLVELVGKRRACLFEWRGARWWVAAERAWLVRQAYGGDQARFLFAAPGEERAATGRASEVELDWLRSVAWETDKAAQTEEAVTDIVRSRMDCSGPRTITELAEMLHLDGQRIELSLLALEGQGQILRGSFRPGAQELEWCNRRILARIHRLTLGSAAKTDRGGVGSRLHAFSFPMAARFARVRDVRGTRAWPCSDPASGLRSARSGLGAGHHPASGD